MDPRGAAPAAPALASHFDQYKVASECEHSELQLQRTSGEARSCIAKSTVHNSTRPGTALQPCSGMPTHWTALASFYMFSPDVALRAPPKYPELSRHFDTQQAALRAQATEVLAQLYESSANETLRMLLLQTMTAILLAERPFPVRCREEVIANLVSHGLKENSDISSVQSCLNLLKIVDPDQAHHIDACRSKLPSICKKRHRKRK